MTISFSCPECFKEYRVKEAFAGKKVKCKSCGGAMQVPSAEATAFEDDDFLGSLNEAARMESRAAEVEDYGAAGLPPKMGGARPSASRSKGSEPARKKKKRKSEGSSGVGKIVALIFLGGIGLLLLVGIVVPAIGALIALPILVIALICQAIGGHWVWGLAFQEDVVCGLLFFVPLYSLYYLITRWESELPFQLAGYGLLGNITMQVYAIMVLGVN